MTAGRMWVIMGWLMILGSLVILRVIELENTMQFGIGVVILIVGLVMVLAGYWQRRREENIGPAPKPDFILKAER